MKTPEEIVYLYRRRHLARGPLIQAMERVRDAYNGDIAIPLPEVSKREDPAVPNLVAQGLDQTSMRIASTLPDLYYHPDRPGFKLWEERARERRRVNLGWWDENNMALKLRRRARWLLGYACSPVLIKPSLSHLGPEWQIRNPLSTFPADTDDPDSITPADCIFAYTRSIDYIQRKYGDQWTSLKRSSESSPDDLVTILEYVDHEQFTCILLSSHASPTDPYVIDATRPYSPPSIRRPAISRHKIIGVQDFALLHSNPNRTGLCPAVVPGRITLDKEQGQYDGIVGMYQTMALLFALEQRAVIQGVWPDTWAIARPNETVEIITEADGRAGIIGKIQGGDIKSMVENPGYMTNPTLDRLEAYGRSGASIPAEYGGESPTNVRTGVRGSNVLSSAIDFPIQEAQVLFEKSLEQENLRAVEIDKAYFGNMPKSYHVNWRGARGPVTYTPNELFTSSHHTVRYSFPGTDMNNLTVIVGQKQGLGNMSRRTAMELDPQIEDVELELDRIQAESLERSMQAAIEQMAVAGAIPPSDVARIATLVRENRMDLAEAITQVQMEAQERQAAQAPPGSPPTQPGIAQPGTGAESATAIPAPTPDVQSLGAALSSLYPSTAAIKQGV